MLRLQKFLLLRRELHHKISSQKMFIAIRLTKMLTRGNVADKKNKTRFLCVLYSDKTWVL